MRQGAIGVASREGINLGVTDHHQEKGPGLMREAGRNQEDWEEAVVGVLQPVARAKSLNSSSLRLLCFHPELLDQKDGKKGLELSSQRHGRMKGVSQIAGASQIKKLSLRECLTK